MSTHRTLAAWLRATLGVSLLAALATGQIFVDDDATGADDGSSWGDAYLALQDALAAADPGDAIWVATGTYRPDLGAGITPGDSHASFLLRSGVALYGGFDGTEASLEERAGLFDQTVLLGLLGPEIYSEHVVTATATDATAVLDGFAIRGPRLFEPTSRGACLLVDAGAPTIARCIFGQSYDVWAWSGGACCNSNGSTTTFIECTFQLTGAVDGGAMLNESGSAPVLRDCTFVGCYADGSGGAILNRNGSDAVLVGCTFVGNEADFQRGGAVANEASSPTLIGCTFVGNRSSEGGAISNWDGSEPLLEGCLFNGNYAYFYGGAIANLDGRPNLVACTLTANSAGRGGGMWSWPATGSVATVVDTIFWGNWCFDIACGYGQISGEVPVIAYSCLQDLPAGWGGPGTIDDDPLFIDPVGADGFAGTVDDDLRLQAGSPCIDAGDVWSLHADVYDVDADGNVFELLPVDLAGLPRLKEDPATADVGFGPMPVLDMGGYEFQTAVVCQGNLDFHGPGEVWLSVCGEDLTQPDQEAILLLTGAPPLEPLLLFIGVFLDPLPVKGGVLVPVPWLVLIDTLVTDGTGSLQLPLSGSTGVPTSVYMQAVARAGPGFLFSNALEITIGT